MTSHTGALVAAPSWGGATADRTARAADTPRAGGEVRFAAPGARAADCAAAAFVLGSSLALWAAALAAMW
jgi:hypothetical protein